MKMKEENEKKKKLNNENQLIINGPANDYQCRETRILPRVKKRNKSRKNSLTRVLKKIIG